MVQLGTEGGYNYVKDFDRPVSGRENYSGFQVNTGLSLTTRKGATGQMALVLLLRFIGSASLLALIAVAMPYAWMDHVHAWLGMGTLPSEPIVGYLARTLSAFYALYGGLLWVLSFDISKNRTIIQYIGIATLAFGLILLSIDWLEGMPFYWKLVEGPIAITYGVLILRLNRERQDG